MKTGLNIVFVSHTFIGSTFVVGSHHLSRELSELGHNICHISTPISPFHMLKIRKDENIKKRFKLSISTEKYYNNVYNFVPISFYTWGVAKRILEKKQKNPLNRAKSIKEKINKFFNNEKIDVMFIDQPTMIGIEDILQPNLLIYRPTDIYSEMLNDRTLLKYELEIIRKSKLVVGTSGPVVDFYKKYLPNKEYYILENGVEYKHFANYIPTLNNDICSLVYIGSLDNRIDINFFIEAARKFPNLNFKIVGPINKEDLAKLRMYKNIVIYGGVDYSEIPTILGDSDIALLPLNDHPANAGRSPMKLYEYLAAGLPVISKKTLELSRRNLDYVFLYDTYESAFENINLLNSNRIDKKIIKNYSKQFSWDSKATELLKIVFK
ncbi:MAG: glycosyltransferase [Niallia nealsonii]|nr:glycosyltransferase [Niallia nealsonii]